MIHLNTGKVLALFVVLLFLSGKDEVFGQTINTDFGKNRVQYHDDFNDWWMYETDHFASFWYGKGRNIVKSVIQLAELDHQEIQQFLGHTMNEKIRIIVYLDHSDYSQTNIAYLEDALESGAGRAQFYDNKIIVYFNGDHVDLRKQIRNGITKAFFHSMFQGVNIENFYNGVNDSDLPTWIVLGLADYLADKWNMRFEEQLRNQFLGQGTRKGFKSFAKSDPVTAGHSMWFFLESRYGKQAMSDFLYHLRIQKDTKNAFEAIFNQSEKEIHKDWKSYYSKHFNSQKNTLERSNQAQLLLKKNWPVTRILPDSACQKIYYVENNYGRIQLKEKWLQENRKDKTLLKYGYKNEHQLTDLHYPLLSMDNSRGQLGVIYEDRDILRLRMIDMDTHAFVEHSFPESVQRIYSFTFYEPGILLMSASTDGFSDIYFYDIKGRQSTRVTNDFYNEQMLISAPGYGSNLFWVISNHKANSLKSVEYDSFPPLSPYRLFLLDPEKDKSAALTVNTDHDLKDALLAGEKVIFRSEYNNMSVPEIRQLIDWKPAAEPAYLNLPANIIAHGYSLNRYFYVYSNFEHQHVLEMIMLDTARLVADIAELWCNKTLPAKEIEQKEPEPDLYDIQITESLLFQTKFPDPLMQDGIMDELWEMRSTEEAGWAGQIISTPDLPVFDPVQAVAARLRFSFNELVTRLDNEPIIDGLIPFDVLNREFHPQTPGMLMSMRVKDMFEDHVVDGGVRIAGNFRGSEYFLHYFRLKQKIDWQYTLYRKTETRFELLSGLKDEPDKLRQLTTLGRVQVRYPFDIYRSIRSSLMFRQDETGVKAADYESLNRLMVPAQRLILELSYVFDNTSSKGINLWSGIRYKVFAAVSNRFDIRMDKPAVFNLSTGRMLMTGFDFRYYQDVGKYSTLAFRSAGQTSMGTEKNIYFLGGVENGYFERNSDTYPIPVDEEFAYMMQVGNLRGFERNARNGSSFLLMNAEYRLPVFRILSENHLRSNFLRDMQLTCFFDLGTAWYGLTPFSSENEANSYIYEAPPAILFRIKQFNDPLIGALGMGFRTRILGYFVKLDYAWGIENLRFRSPMLHFSIGHDF